MKTAITAGSTFAVVVLIGFWLGLRLAQRTGAPLWVVGGLFAGMAVGGVIAARSLLQAGK